MSFSIAKGPVWAQSSEDGWRGCYQFAGFRAPLTTRGNWRAKEFVAKAGGGEVMILV